MTDDTTPLPSSPRPDEPSPVDPLPLHQEVEERLAQMDVEVEAAYQRGFEAGRDVAESLLVAQVEHYRKLVDAYDEEVKRLRGKLKQ